MCCPFTVFVLFQGALSFFHYNRFRLQAYSSSKYDVFCCGAVDTPVEQEALSEYLSVMLHLYQWQNAGCELNVMNIIHARQAVVISTGEACTCTHFRNPPEILDHLCSFNILL